MKVTVSNGSGNRRTVNVPATTTLRSCFEQAGIEYGAGFISIDGEHHDNDGALDMRLNEFTTDDAIQLMAVAKLTNA